MPWKTVDEGRAWTFEYVINKNGVKANACAVKLREGELLVLTPPCGVSDADYAELEKHGRPVALVATNGFHHLGLPEWKKRYPDAKLFAPAASAARIAKKQPGLPTFEPISKLAELCPPEVAVFEPPGMRIPDVMARVSGPGGALWFFNDVVMNVENLGKGILPLLMKWTDSGPGFKVMRLFTMVGVKDKRAFKPWLLSELSKAPPTKIAVGHGAPVLDSAVASRLPQMIEQAI